MVFGNYREILSPQKIDSINIDSSFNISNIFEFFIIWSSTHYNQKFYPFSLCFQKTTHKLCWLSLPCHVHGFFIGKKNLVKWSFYILVNKSHAWGDGESVTGLGKSIAVLSLLSLYKLFLKFIYLYHHNSVYRGTVFYILFL